MIYIRKMRLKSKDYKNKLLRKDKIMNSISIQLALESYKFGINITYDGDNHKIMYATNCIRCGNYFESVIAQYYCNKCIGKGEI